MRASCERAIEVGLPAIAFTEHVDHAAWRVAADGVEDHLTHLVRDDQLHPPPFDAAGYLQEVEECRERYPGLRILSGLEVGEPHRHPRQVAELLASGPFDRFLGSLHSLVDGDHYAESDGLFVHRDPAEVMRTYLAEVAVLVGSDQPFEVLAHIDYPLRAWPRHAAPFVPSDFEEEFRHALAVARGFAEAAQMAAAHGFRPGRLPHELWGRS